MPEPQVPRGHRQRTPERHLPHAREQLLMDLGEVTADDHGARVEEVDALGEHLADRAAGVAHRLRGLRIARRGRATRRRACCWPRARPCVSRIAERAAARDGLQAARVAAAAHDVLVPGEPDVPDVPRRALRAAVDPVAGDDPAADAGADLHVQQVLAAAPVRVVLAQRHDVHVVVDEHGHVVVLGEPVGDREAVPAGHHRRRDRLAAGERDRRGDADADAAHVFTRAIGLAQQVVEAFVDPVENLLGKAGDVGVVALLGQRRRRRDRSRRGGRGSRPGRRRARRRPLG